LISLNDIKNIGFNGVITNAYLLWKKLSKSIVDIHKHLEFDGVVMTDSGAYQILRYGDIEVSNREIVKYQCSIGSDIGVILDVPTPYIIDREIALKSAEITLQRGIEVSDIIEHCKDTLWVLPIQGGVFLDILKSYAKRSTEICGYGYNIYALGSPTTLLENYMFDNMIEMIFTVRSSIEPSKPLHLFGAGHPLIMPFAIAIGVDLMDSASYILYARDRRYMTRRGTYKLNELNYLPCSCPICSRYTKEELMKMPTEELVKSLALHNLYTLYLELKEVKESIREGRLWEYLEEKSRTHPAARRAFETLKKYLEFIYKRTPYEKPRGKGLFIVSEEDSAYNPKIMIPRRKILDEIVPEKKCLIFIPLIQRYEVEYVEQTIKRFLTMVGRKLKYGSEKCSLYFYHPVLGVIPYLLVNVYPFSQFETYNKYSYQSIKTLVYILIEYLLKALRRLKCDKVIIFIHRKIEWQKTFEKIIKNYIDYIRVKGMYMEIIDIDVMVI